MLDQLHERSVTTPNKRQVKGELVWIFPDRWNGRTYATVRNEWGEEATGRLDGTNGIAVAYNVAHKLARPIQDGQKHQLLLSPQRQTHARQGEKLHFFTGRGTENARHLGEFTCTGAFPIEITSDSMIVEGDYIFNGTMRELALSQGFLGWTDMVNWLERSNRGLPWQGTLITW